MRDALLTCSAHSDTEDANVLFSVTIYSYCMLLAEMVVAAEKMRVGFEVARELSAQFRISI